jgi:ABC-type transport system substrate-binding protein
MKRKFAAVVAGCVTCSLLVAGCGSSGTNTSTSNSSNSGNGTTESTSSSSSENGGNTADSSATGFIQMDDFNGLIDTSRKSTANSDERYDTVKLAQFASPTELQPINYQDLGKALIVPELYETLLEVNNDNEYVNLLAKDWEQIDDVTYEFTLYDYIHDSDGNAITSSDVAFSYDLNKNGGYAQDFDLYDHIEVIDDYTFDIILTEAIDDLTSFQAIFASPKIVSEKAYNAGDFNNSPVATGPYKVESFTSGNNITLVVNEDYWQTDELTIESKHRNCNRISFDIIGDSALRLIALEDGSSMSCTLSSEDFQNFMTGGQYEGQYYLLENDEPALYDIIPNITTDSPLNDINLRLAVFYAIDSVQYVQTQNELITKSSVVESIPSYDDYNAEWETWDTYNSKYDMDLAKEYLAKSSYNGETLSILLEDMPAKEAIAEVLQLQLEALGVKAKINEIAHALMTDTTHDTTAWDLLMMSGSSADYTISRLKSIFEEENGYAGCIFTLDQDFQDMLHKCARLSGYSEELTSDILKYIIDNAYSYACTYSSSVTAYSHDFAGIYLQGGLDIVPGSCDYYLD